MVNSWTGKLWCIKCNRLGCKGGIRHYTFNFGIWFEKKHKILWQRLTALDYSKIDDVELDGVDTRDYPDFCDAFIASATYKGKEMTEKQLEKLNNDSSFIYDCVIARLF